MTGARRFLCWVTGFDPVDRELAEVTRAVTRGCLLLATTTLAFASGTVFGYDLLHLGRASIAFAVFWAAFVFVIDRYIIVSLDFQRGTKKVLTGMVRLGIAAVIGFVIAAPLVLRAFSSEVSAQVGQSNREQLAVANGKLKVDPRYGDARRKALRSQLQKDLEAAKAKGAALGAVLNDPGVKKLQKQIDDVQKKIDEKNNELGCEIGGTCGTERAGDGPKSAELRRIRDYYQSQRNALEQDLSAAKADAKARLANRTAAGSATAKSQVQQDRNALEEAQSGYDNQLATNKKILDQNGLAAQMEALSTLRAKNGSVNGQFWLLTMLLVILDTSAVGLKLLEPAAVEDKLRAIEEDSKVERANKRRRSDLERLENWQAHLADAQELELAARHSYLTERSRAAVRAAQERFAKGIDHSGADLEEEIHRRAEAREAARERMRPRSGSAFREEQRSAAPPPPRPSSSPSRAPRGWHRNTWYQRMRKFLRLGPS